MQDDAQAKGSSGLSFLKGIHRTTTGLKSYLRTLSTGRKGRLNTSVLAAVPPLDQPRWGGAPEWIRLCGATKVSIRSQVQFQSSQALALSIAIRPKDQQWPRWLASHDDI